VTSQFPEEWPYESVPQSAVRLFRMSWQLETWLRTLVYVELRAARLEWEQSIKQRVRDWPPHSLQKDKSLHHMVTPHQAALSYLTLGQLWDVISDDDNWPLFAPYFPPKENADVRVQEVKAIRNRVAHFRDPHPQDADRLQLFLSDIDKGIHRFCSRYTVGRRPRDSADDPVTEHLAQSWDDIGYGIELCPPDGKWLYAPPPNRQRPLLHARLEWLTHACYARASLQGIIYRLTTSAPVSGTIDVVDFLEGTRSVHKDIIHILLTSDHEITVTIPAVHGTERTAELVSIVLSASLNSSRSHTWRNLKRARLDWPEYVLWPDHVLTFFTAECQAPVLDFT
jgi:hypothetical protein